MGMTINEQSVGNPTHGYSLDFDPPPGAHQHDFCGSHNITGAVCPYCEKPLLRMMSLSSADPVLNFPTSNASHVHLLFCQTCSIPFGEFSYKINPDGSVALLKVPERNEDMEFGMAGPYDGYTGNFRLHKVSLVALDNALQSRMETRFNQETEDEDDLEDPLAPMHQVGGFPFIYNPYKMTCPSCKKEMPLLATICNDVAGNNPWRGDELNTFVGNGGVQTVFHYCRDCSVVSVYQSCD
jgi:hypothetical protein